MGFRRRVLGFGAKGLGFRVHGLRLGAASEFAGYRLQGLGFSAFF